MKFITAYPEEGGDMEYFVTIDESQNRATIKKNKFVFLGFSNTIHPYHRAEIDWICTILKSKGIFLNIIEVPTVEDMGNDNSGTFTYNSLALKDTNGILLKSDDESTYTLFQDTEMGRGWACLIKDKNIIIQEHRDTVRDILLEGDFIRSLGIDYQTQTFKEEEGVLSKYFEAKEIELRQDFFVVETIQ